MKHNGNKSQEDHIDAELTPCVFVVVFLNCFSASHVCLMLIVLSLRYGSYARTEGPLEFGHVKSSKLLAKVRPNRRLGLLARKPCFEGPLELRQVKSTKLLSTIRRSCRAGLSAR